MRFHFIVNWYTRYERLISSLSLIGGFIFDIFALKRIDLFWENLWVAMHLLVAAFGIVLINFYENKKQRFSQKTQSRIHFWLIIIIQFAFGGLLSTFLVFYFRSGTFSASWPFLLLLCAVFAFNEILKKQYTRLVFQTIMVYVSIYSFAIFIVPVIFHQIGDGMFLLSGVVSLFVLSLFLFALRYISRERFSKSKKLLIFYICVLTILINVLYFTNLIPPIPLSLKDAGVYHSITKGSGSTYVALEEPQTFWDFFKPYQLFHQVPGQPVYVYTSIFSPTHLNVEVIHDWQHYNSTTGKWDSINQIHLSIVGGRDEGFRTYSIRTVNLTGLWRVDVKTPKGQLIGRVKFEIQSATTSAETIKSIL